MSKWMSRRHRLSRAQNRSGRMKGNPKYERCGLVPCVKQGSLGLSLSFFFFFFFCPLKTH
uniref:Alternative protein GAB3 n=1 Tax=Homo sapiens TaxID=9606 RepID=L0R5B0_HUMAN|nr:alternative protein GAB3 [Homo sapiens]